MRKKKFCSYCASRLVEKLYEGRIRPFCENCNEPVYENPVPASCLIVVDEKNRMLLVKRSVEPKKGEWCLPGGFMELGEKPESCALRELKEETGLSGEIDGLVGIFANHNAAYDTVLLFCYSVKRFSGDLFPGDDASETVFFDPENIPEIAFESHRYFVSSYYNSRCLEAN